MSKPLQGDWGDKDYRLGFYWAVPYRCGFCGREVSSERGWQIVWTDVDLPPEDEDAQELEGYIRICPNCKRPTFFEEGTQYPKVPIGEPVANLPNDVEGLFNEARVSASSGAPTASVLCLRKLLMNIAVNKGAPVDKTFQQYVDFLARKGYVPPDGKGWVDHIRNKGNDANHEIALMDSSDAKELIDFAGMLLTFIYEFPGRVPKVQKKENQAATATA